MPSGIRYFFHPSELDIGLLISQIPTENSYERFYNEKVERIVSTESIIERVQNDNFLLVLTKNHVLYISYISGNDKLTNSIDELDRKFENIQDIHYKYVDVQYISKYGYQNNMNKLLILTKEGIIITLQFTSGGFLIRGDNENTFFSKLMQHIVKFFVSPKTGNPKNRLGMIVLSSESELFLHTNFANEWTKIETKHFFEEKVSDMEYLVQTDGSISQSICLILENGKRWILKRDDHQIDHENSITVRYGYMNNISEYWGIYMEEQKNE